MSAFFQELDYQPSPIGALSLRRRWSGQLGVDVYEIKLGDDFLMSSAFTASEIALAEVGLAAVTGEKRDVLVGGLGLGYTAQAVLAHESVRSLTVVEMLAPVIDWHRTGLLPLGPALTGDHRCRLVQGDFFAMAGSEQGFDSREPGRRFHAILLDIDHSPEAFLDERSARFYDVEGLGAMARFLRPSGVFGLWSNEPPDAAFTARLSEAFVEAWAEPVTFHNPLQNCEVTQTVYLARKVPASSAGSVT